MCKRLMVLLIIILILCMVSSIGYGGDFSEPTFFPIPEMDMHGYMQEADGIDDRTPFDMAQTDEPSYFVSVHGRTVGYVVCHDEDEPTVHFTYNYRDYKGDSITRSVKGLLALKSSVLPNLHTK